MTVIKGERVCWLPPSLAKLPSPQPRTQAACNATSKPCWGTRPPPAMSGFSHCVNQWQRWGVILLIPGVNLLLSVVPLCCWQCLDGSYSVYSPIYPSEETFLRPSLSCDNRSRPLVTPGILLLTWV